MALWFDENGSLQNVRDWRGDIPDLTSVTETSGSADPSAMAAAARDAADYVLETTFTATLRADQLMDEAKADLDASLRSGDPMTALSHLKSFGEEVAREFGREVEHWLNASPNEMAHDQLAGRLTMIAEQLKVDALAYGQAHRVLRRANTAEEALSRLAQEAGKVPETALDVREQGDRILDLMTELGTAPDAVDRRRMQFHAEVAEAAVMALVDRDPADALARLDAGALDDLIGDADAKEILRRRADELRRANEEDEERERELAVQRTREVDDLSALTAEHLLGAAIERGEGAYADIDRAELTGEIDALQAARLRARLAGADEAAATRRRDVQEASAALRSAMIENEAVITDDPHWPDKVNAFYEDLLMAVPEGDPQARGFGVVDANLVDELAHLAGVVPKALGLHLTREMNSDEPARIVAAARRVGDLFADPNLRESLAGTMHADTLVQAFAVLPDADIAELGLTPERALRRGQERLADFADRAEREAAERQQMVRYFVSHGRNLLPSPALQDAARKGRGGDTTLGKLPGGAVVVPVDLQSPSLLAAIEDAFARTGKSAADFTVGNRYPAETLHDTPQEEIQRDAEQ